MFTSLFAFVLQFLGGGIVKDILGHLQAKTDAQTERQRMETQALIAAIQAEVEARAQARAIMGATENTNA